MVPGSVVASEEESGPAHDRCRFQLSATPVRAAANPAGPRIAALRPGLGDCGRLAAVHRCAIAPSYAAADQANPPAIPSLKIPPSADSVHARRSRPDPESLAPTGEVRAHTCRMPSIADI